MGNPLLPNGRSDCVDKVALSSTISWYGMTSENFKNRQYILKAGQICENWLVILQNCIFLSLSSSETCRLTFSKAIINSLHSSEEMRVQLGLNHPHISLFSFPLLRLRFWFILVENKSAGLAHAITAVDLEAVSDFCSAVRTFLLKSTHR